jgi:hypothetical protein
MLWKVNVGCTGIERIEVEQYEFKVPSSGKKILRNINFQDSIS